MPPSEVLKLALAALALSGAACSAGGAAPSARDRTAGLYKQNCAACHGPDGSGRQVGTVTVPSIRDGRAASYTDERLFRQIYDGGRGMPPFKYTLDDDQIKDLARFVREEIQKGSRQ